MKKETTIQLSRQTVNELNNLKVHPRQSYREIIFDLLKTKKKLNFLKFISMNSFTTIQISKSLADNLNSLKVHPRQSYEEIIQALIK